jgi:hypothetical protein
MTMGAAPFRRFRVRSEGTVTGLGVASEPNDEAGLGAGLGAAV